MRTHHHLITKKLEETFIRKAALAVAVIGPLFTAPQAYEIFKNKSAENLSLVTWSFWSLSSLVWLMYARLTRDTVLTVSSALWVLFDVSVAVGILIYG